MKTSIYFILFYLFWSYWSSTVEQTLLPTTITEPKYDGRLCYMQNVEAGRYLQSMLTVTPLGKFHLSKGLKTKEDTTRIRLQVLIRMHILHHITNTL